MTQNEMVYAPIAITTLNRYDHFVRCIKSLQNNSQSEFTVLYISIDYPPLEKYVDGYNKIIDYLNKGIDGFKEVKIFKQEKNLGPIKNSLFLKKKVFELHDRAIFLEDDNELSPCFIEFCNKGLQLYENDKDIIALNGSSYVWCGEGFTDNDKELKEGENNIVKRQLLFHSWATWRETWYELYNFCKSYDLYYLGKDLLKMIRLHSKSRCFFYFYIHNVLGSKNNLPWYDQDKLFPTDAVWDIYMMINNKYIIAPKVSLIRDWGVDGSGANYTSEFSNKDTIINKKIDENNKFEYICNDSLEIDTNEVKLHDKHNFKNIKSIGIAIIIYIKYLFFKK